MMTPEELLSRIDRFLKARGDYSASRLGRDAVGDPNFVRDLREKGREPRRRTIERARAFLDQIESAEAA